jgi:hypothetical protein
LHFQRAIPPEWVLEALNNINLSTTIGFEDGEPNTVAELELEKDPMVTPEQLATAIDEIKLEDDVELIGGREYATVVHHSLDSIEEVWKQEMKQDIKQEPIKEEDDAPDPIAAPEPGVYITRFGRVSHPPDRLIESAYVVVKEQYIMQFQDPDPESISKVTETI